MQFTILPSLAADKAFPSFLNSLLANFNIILVVGDTSRIAFLEELTTSAAITFLSCTLNKMQSYAAHIIVFIKFFWLVAETLRALYFLAFPAVSDSNLVIKESFGVATKTSIDSTAEQIMSDVCERMSC